MSTLQKKEYEQLQQIQLSYELFCEKQDKNRTFDMLNSCHKGEDEVRRVWRV